VSSTHTEAAASIPRSAAPDELPFYLTVLEWRQYLGLSRTTAYSLIRSGVVPVLKVGRHLRIPRSALKTE
jgi:excisionase family DNA binding protein